MNFKKYNEMELAMLASIATMNEEMAKNISMEKGDIDFSSIEEYISVPSYLSKPDSARHAIRRKDTFKKKVKQKTLARDLGYDLSTERNCKKVKDLLSSNHSDRTYFRGYKTESKHMNIQKEMDLMEEENWEKARSAMMEEHDSILGAIAQDVDTLTLDLKSSEYSIENLEAEYKELEEDMKLVYEKLQNAYLRKNGIKAALLQKEAELDTLSANLKRERISHFGW